MTVLSRCLCSSLLLLLVGIAPAWAAVCRVSVIGTAGNDGSDWSVSMDLQTALANPNCTEVWVREGWYVPGALQSDSFRVLPDTEVYGGFNGTETSREQRDPAAYASILSGDIDSDDVNNDNNLVAEAHTDIAGGNSRHVVVMDGNLQSVFSNTVLDGFTITAGDNSNNNEGGGGLWCIASGNTNRHCSPTLRNLVVSGNRAQYGGGIAIQGETDASSSAQLSDIVFRGNHATDGGGALFSDGYRGVSSSTLTRVSFIGNSAIDEAGAMYNYAYEGTSRPALTDVVFSDNSADFGGAMHNEAFGGVSSPTLERVRFSGNSAGTDGGAIYNDGHAGNSSPLLTDVLFENNDAAFGGAMYNHGDDGISMPSLSAVTFSGNTAGRGGALYNGGFTGVSNATLTNVTFDGNAATGEGGAIANVSSTGGESRAAVFNATFSGNTGSAGAAIFNLTAGGASHAQLTNAIVWDNSSTTGPPIANSGSGATSAIQRGLVEGGCPAGSVCTGPVSGDPLLGTLAYNGGFTPTLLPSTGSTAIDAGTCAGAPATDQRGVIRPQGPGCDIGAVEIAVDRGGTVCRVDASATPPGDGFSWASAYTELQFALVDSTCQIVWVADGVYTPGASVADTFLVRAGMGVYGGFAGTEASIDQRDVLANPTILSGDTGGDDEDVDGNHIAETWVDIAGSNSRHVVTLDGNIAPIDLNTVLDGFTITAGDNGNNNDGGGGLWCRAFNSASARCSPALQHLVLSGNRAQYGGGMAIQGEAGASSAPRISDVAFHGNRATVAGGALFNDGIQGESSPTLVRVVFRDNSAADAAGALYNYGRSTGTSNPSLTDVVFDRNSASLGGAVYNDGELGESSPVLRNTTFTQNAAGQNGGAIYNNAEQGVSSPRIDNATFVGNHAAANGGAVYNFDFQGESSPAFTNVTFSGNAAVDGGGAMYSYGSDGDGMPVLTNAILWDNTAKAGPHVYDFFGARTTIDHADIDGGCPPGVDACAHIVTGDPLLGPLADNGGFTPTLLPASGSAAIDAGTCIGTPASDQRGVARPQGAACDLGAVEYVPEPAIFADGFE